MNRGHEKRKRGRPKTVDRQRVIEVAMELYWREGLHAVSLNELCRRVGISKPALYREFGGEDGLMEAALEHYRRQVIVPLLMPLATDYPFADMLDRAIVTLTSDREAPLGCLFTKMRLAGSRLGSVTATRVRALEQEQRAAFEAWYRRALASNEADAAISPELAAHYIDTQFATILVQMAVGEPPDRIRAQARLALRVLKNPTRVDATRQ